MTVHIYYDDFDAQGDGFGWNMTHDDDAVALRYETVAQAFASAQAWHPTDNICWCHTSDAALLPPPMGERINPFDVAVIR